MPASSESLSAKPAEKKRECDAGWRPAADDIGFPHRLTRPERRAALISWGLPAQQGGAPAELNERTANCAWSR
jgi:hypothetical protein